MYGYVNPEFTPMESTSTCEQIDIYIIIHYFTTSVVTSGWSSIIATICLMSGLLMMCIGIVGTYVGNIFMPVKERPLYIVRTVLNDKENKECKIL